MQMNARAVERKLRPVAGRRVLCLTLLLQLLSLLPGEAIADGCFVFRWDKNADINEPTQKAIILHDAGREDLLLQVKYEGSLDDFGWLVPVPGVPKVQKGSMDAFYELSMLTQRRFEADSGGKGGATLSAAESSAPPDVKVIEVKTVGAYEIAVLEARDAGSLERWLQSHDYSVPKGKSELLDKYISKGWCFVATRIDLKQLKAAKSGPKRPDTSADQRALKQQLRSGELHPLLISFDTPTCIFPLKISAVAGKPSEVSLYVLSAKPLVSQFLLEEACARLDQRYAQLAKQRPEQERMRMRAMQNVRKLNLAWQMYAEMYTEGRRQPGRPNSARRFTPEELSSLAEEDIPPDPPRSLEEDFYAGASELLHCMEVKPAELKKTAQSLPRLKGPTWFLTKHVRTFAPEEMRDLEFVPAIPALSATLNRPAGLAAAEALAQLEPEGRSIVVAGLRSNNERSLINSLHVFERITDKRALDPLLPLMDDKRLEIRLHAIRAASCNWDQRFRKPLIALFSDSNQEIRSEAAGSLASHDKKENAPVYVGLLKAPEPNVRLCAISVLLRIDRDAIPSEPLVALLRSAKPELQSAALHLLWQLNRDAASRADLVPLLNSPHIVDVGIAMKLIEGNGRVQPALQGPQAEAREREMEKRRLTSAEAAGLVTNKLAQARLAGLKVLQRNADAQAVELILPLLHDANSAVRRRAFDTIAAVTGTNIPEDNAAKWEQWWAKNKGSFPKPRSS